MSDTLVLERIYVSLARLRLSRLAEVLETILRSAEEKSNSYLSFLDELLQEEVAQKDNRRIETAIKTSGLPFIKTIDEFDFTFQPKLDRQKIMSLFDLTFVRQKGNVIFLGPPGVGKTHLAVALVIVYEVGYTPIDRKECNLFFRFIATRYEKSSTVITSNKAFSDWTELFQDQVVVTAILDRRLHHSVVINIKGNSYRLKGKVEKEASGSKEN